MPFDYASSAATAHTLLQNFGADVELRVYDTGTLNPITGEITTSSFTSGTAVGAILSGGSRSDQSRNSRRDTRQVKMERRKMYVTPYSTIAPTSGVVIIAEGIAWDVTSSFALSPAGTAVLYSCTVERSSRSV
jgi:hypothetical protein